MTDPRPSDACHGRRQILVVHRDHDVRESIGATLRDDGHDVDIAANGPIAVMRASVRQPDVVVFDLPVPPRDEDALFVGEMRTRFLPAPAVVALSGSPSGAWTVPGVSVFLVNPLGATTLLRAAVKLAARTIEPSPRQPGSGVRRSVVPRSILILANVLDSAEIEGALGGVPIGAQFVVADTESDALTILRKSTPTLLIVGSRRSELLSAEALARRIDIRVVDE